MSRNKKKNETVRVSVREFNCMFGRTLNAAATGDTIIVTKYNKPSTVVISYDWYKQLLNIVLDKLKD